LEEKLDNVLNKFRETNPAPPETSSKSDPKEESGSTSKPSEVVCEGGVCYKKPIESEKSQEKPKEPAKTPEVPASKSEELPDASKPEDPVKISKESEKSVEVGTASGNSPTEDDKVKRAMQLIEQKRKEKADEEEKAEKEREIRRRKEGQELQNLKKWQEDQEMKEVMLTREKERREAKAAREKVLQQIAQDKADRAAKFSQIPVESKVEPAAASKLDKPAVNADTARIQFKKPDGSNETHTFNSSQIYSDLHLFVKNTVLANSNIKEFKLAIAFPRREFTAEDNQKTLLELGLTPASVLLIIPTKKSFSATPSNILPTQTSGMVAMLQSLVMGLMTPVFALFNYIKNIVMGGGQGGAGETANEAGKRKRNEETISANDA
jgi:hypothetical protein